MCMPCKGHDFRQQAAHHSQYPQGRWQHPASPSPVRGSCRQPCCRAQQCASNQAHWQQCCSCSLDEHTQDWSQHQDCCSAWWCQTHSSTAQCWQGRAAVKGISRAARAAPTRAGPAALAPAVQRAATIRATARSSTAAASAPAEQSVAKHKEASSQTRLVLLDRG